MFWNKKNTERIAGLEEKMEAKLDALTQRIADGNIRLDEMGGNLDKVLRLVQEQGMSVEDLLEEWTERTAETDDLRARLRECAEQERHLLELFEAYQEQFRNLERFARNRDEEWTAQMAMMERSLERYRQACGITLVGECGMEVDYGLHEVVGVTDTGQPDQDRKIADIYRSGYLYQGKVRRKAQVAAYKFKSGEAVKSDDHTEEKERNQS